MSSEPLILITNDDGIGTAGLDALVEALAPLGRIVVAAPHKERSASGHAITIGQPLRARKRRQPADCWGWSITGTPADCVKLALTNLLDTAPTLVVSGINYGLNAGANIIYSGTISGAREAAILGIPAVAISLQASNNPDFGTAGEVSRKVVEYVLNLDPDRMLLNVNIPAVPLGEIAGFSVTTHGNSRLVDYFEKREDPQQRPYYWLAWEKLIHDDTPGSDHHALTRKMVSLTPLSLDHTDYSAVENLRNHGLGGLEREASENNEG